jgi:hypothetical protein
VQYNRRGVKQSTSDRYGRPDIHQNYEKPEAEMSFLPAPNTGPGCAILSNRWTQRGFKKTSQTWKKAFDSSNPAAYNPLHRTGRRLLLAANELVLEVGV